MKVSRFKRMIQSLSSKVCNKLTFKFLFSLLLAVIVINTELLPFVTEAFASPAEATNKPSFEVKDFLNKIVAALTVGFKVIQQLIWPVLLLMGPLLDNSLIYGPGIEDRLFDIWVQFRNLTNLIIAILLIGVTLYNLLGIGEGGTYELKSFFKKMVIALVAINFSFFGARLILDASNVVTTFAFSLPNTVQSHSADSLGRIEDSLCSTLIQVGSGIESGVFSGFNTFSVPGTDQPKFCNGTSLTKEAKAFFSRVTSSNLSMIMAGNYANIADGLQASRTFQVTLDTVNLTINALLSMIIILVHGAAYLSLFAILLVRLVFLWLSIAVSPLVVFASVVGISAFDELQKLWGQFMTHAFAPAKVGFAMSISYIIFSAIEKNGLSSSGIGLGGDLTYPFSGIGTIEKFFVTIGAAVIVYDVALDVGSKTRASLFTNAIQTFTSQRFRQAGRVFKRLPIAMGPSGPLTLGSMGKTLSNLEGKLTDTQKTSGATPKDIVERVKANPSTAKISPEEFIEMSRNPRQYNTLTWKQVQNATRLGKVNDKTIDATTAAASYKQEAKRKLNEVKTKTTGNFS